MSVSALHQKLLIQHGLAGRMSRKNNFRDNAVMERFFSNLKMERDWQLDQDSRVRPEKNGNFE